MSNNLLPMTRSLCLISLWILTSIFCLAMVHAQTSQQPEREQARKQLQLIEDHLAGKDVGQPWIEWRNVEPEQLLDYLKLSKEDDQLRLEAITLARKYARPADLIKKPDAGSGYHYLAHDRLRFAWRILTETGVLHKGMSLEEASAILGPPDVVYENKTAGVYIVDWTYDSVMHINPALRCTFKGGVIEKIERVSK
jgi:hypothetical protein